MSVVFLLLGAGVALRKESVDRNAREESGQQRSRVALRKESVDRNADIGAGVGPLVRRSPQGERG